MMESRIQNIVDKIYQDGIDRAEQKSQELLQETRLQAENLVEDAKKKAAHIIENANRESQSIKETTEAEIRLAASRALADLRRKIENSLSHILLDEKIEKLSFDTQFLKEMILAITKNWKENSESIEVEVLLPEQLKSRFEETFNNGIVESLNNIEIRFSDRISSGFQISKKGSGYYLNFDNRALIEFFRPFLSRKIEEYFRVD